MADEKPGRSRAEHREAVRLSWLGRHVPVRALFIGGLLVAGVASAIYMVIALGPSNPIP